MTVEHMPCARTILTKEGVTFRPTAGARQCSSRPRPAIRSLSAPVRHCERCMLIGLECDLLCQHNVADGKAPLRPEAPDGDLHTILVEFVNVHLTTAADAIALPAVAARHIEAPRPLVLASWTDESHCFSRSSAFCSASPPQGGGRSRYRPHAWASPSIRTHRTKTNSEVKSAPDINSILLQNLSVNQPSAEERTKSLRWRKPRGGSRS